MLKQTFTESGAKMRAVNVDLGEIPSNLAVMTDLVILAHKANGDEGYIQDMMTEVFGPLSRLGRNERGKDDETFSHRGYRIAAQCDNIINEALQTFPIEDEENRLGYQALIRTLQTTLNVLKGKLMANAAAEQPPSPDVIPTEDIMR